MTSARRIEYVHTCGFAVCYNATATATAVSDGAHTQSPYRLYSSCRDGRSEEHCLSSLSSIRGGGRRAHTDAAAVISSSSGVVAVIVVAEGQLLDGAGMGDVGRLVVLFLEHVCDVSLILHSCLRLVLLLRLSSHHITSEKTRHTH